MKTMKRKYSSVHEKEYNFTVVYEPVEEGGYQVTVPVLQGLVTFGRTLEEAREMVRDAIRCYAEALIKEKERIPKENAILQERLSLFIKT